MSKYEELKANIRTARNNHSQNPIARTFDNIKRNESTLESYIIKAAEMHDELVETLEEFMYGKPDADKIKDMIKRAKEI